MPKYRVAHIREQGIDLIIIPLEASFATASEEDQEETTAELQYRCEQAGLAGTVVCVCDAGGGRMFFNAPEAWHPYFRSINLRFVYANLNREVWW